MNATFLCRRRLSGFHPVGAGWRKNSRYGLKFMEVLPMTVAVTGIVRDSGGHVVANARVAFASAPVAVPDIAVLTDSKGAFALSAPAPGRYVVACYADGYSPATVAVHVSGLGPVHLEIQLEQPGP